MPNAALTIDLILQAERFNRSMTRVTKTMNRVRDVAQSVAVHARRMFLAASAAAGAATFVFASFEKEMSRVKALSGATAKEFDNLSESARKLGKTTQFSANQAAQAMSAFALQGFKTNEIIGSMPATLSLAAAGQLSMGQAASITAGVMRGMKLDIQDLTRVVDVLAKAATSSATDVPMLGEAMRALGPVAKTTGVSLEETVAVIRAFSDVMIQGSSAGVALRNILLRLQKQPTEVAKHLKALNITVADSSGKMKKVATLVDEFSAALENKTQVTRNAIIADVAGLRAAAAFSEILALGGDRIRQYTRELEGAAGTADRIARIQMDNLAGSFRLLTSAVQEFAIKLGSVMEPALRSFLELMTSIMTEMNKWGDTTTTLIVAMGAGTIAVTGFLAVLPSLILVLSQIPRALLLMTAAMESLRYPIATIMADPRSLLRLSIVNLIGFKVAAMAAAASVVFLAVRLNDMVNSWRSAETAASDYNSAIKLMDLASDKLREGGAGKERVKNLEALITAKENLISVQTKEIASLSIYVMTAEQIADTTQVLTKRNKDLTRQVQEHRNAIGEILSSQKKDTDAKEEAASEVEKLSSAVRGLAKELRTQLDTWGQSANRVDLYKLSLKGATGAQLGMVEALIKEVEAREKADRASKASVASHKAEIGRSHDVVEAAEQLRHEIARAQGTLTAEDEARFKHRGLRATERELKTLIELEGKLAAAIDLRKDKRGSFAATFESLGSLFTRIQAAAASGRTADPTGKYQSAMTGLNRRQLNQMAQSDKKLQGILVAIQNLQVGAAYQP